VTMGLPARPMRPGLALRLRQTDAASLAVRLLTGAAGPNRGIAIRFPEPVALTQELVRDLYQQAGCSSTHIELLTGQSAATVRRGMAEWGIPLRGAPSSPVLKGGYGPPAPAMVAGGCRAL
jgi:hypothetical protein